jgi:ribonucleotide reductase alpha subunit
MQRTAQILSDLAFYRTYSQVKPTGLKESWNEVINRYQQFLLDQNSTAQHDLIVRACTYVRNKQIVPSMRMLQFAGQGLSRENLRAYNCSFVAIKDFNDISDIFYILMNGTGVGFSVQQLHVSQLPTITPNESEEFAFGIVGDSREAWAQSVKVLLENPNIEFDYSQIRAAGTRLSTGGTASGPESLRRAHENIRRVLRGAQGRKLRPIEVHDIVCYIADVVVVGGVRRAALISLFDRTDEEMLYSKVGAWWERNPQRARANNSAVLVRGETTQAEFERVLDMCLESKAGEPGIFWTNDRDYGTNPCVPAGTQILTKQGYQNIETLVGKQVEVWNGFEWSEVTPAITGHNQALMKVTLSDGRTLTCTPAHKWVIQEGFSKQGTQVRKSASQLEVGDRLIKHDFPVLHGGTAVDAKNAYSQGFISAEGMDNYDFCWLYNTKVACASRMNGEIKGSAFTTKTGSSRWRFQFNTNALPKSFVPFSWDVPSRLQWFAGLLDGDGTITKDKNIQLTSVDRNFLGDVQKLLSTLGVQSKVVAGKAAGVRLLPDGNGGKREFDCQQTYRLLLGATQVQDLVKLGLNTVRLNLSGLPNRDATRFVKVVKLEDAGHADIVYCFTEPKRNLGCFEGVVTGQCAEISLQSQGLCNLTEINAAVCENEFDFAKAAYYATVLGTFQASLTHFNYVKPRWKQVAEQEALLGVSITGQAQNWENLQSWDLAEVADMCKLWNAELAKELGINHAARVTTVKPSGTTSTVLGTAAGIHGVYAPHYIRRVRINRDDPMAIYLQNALPKELVEVDQFQPSMLCIAMPIKMKGIVASQESCVEQLERAKFMHSNWIRPGHNHGPNTHNVSLTVYYREGEDNQILKDWMWQNQTSYSGISLLPLDTHTYIQAPYEAISEERYRELEAKVLAIDLDLGEIRYWTDYDSRQEVSGCEGNLCSLPERAK